MPYAIDALAGRCVLVVEDEYYLADLMACAIRSASGEVRGPFASVAATFAHLAKGAPGADSAILNVVLLDGPSYPIADELKRVGVPVILASGAADAMLPDRFCGLPLLTKPFSALQVVTALTVLA